MTTTGAPTGNDFTVYMVTAGQFDAFCYEAAFSSRELAEQYIAAASKPRNRYDHVNPTVLEMTVHQSSVAEQYDDLPADWPADLQSLPPRIVGASDSPPGAVGLGLVPPGPNPTDRDGLTAAERADVLERYEQTRHAAPSDEAFAQAREKRRVEQATEK